MLDELGVLRAREPLLQQREHRGSILRPNMPRIEPQAGEGDRFQNALVWAKRLISAVDEQTPDQLLVRNIEGDVFLNPSAPVQIELRAEIMSNTGIANL